MMNVETPLLSIFANFPLELWREIRDYSSSLSYWRFMTSSHFFTKEKIKYYTQQFILQKTEFLSKYASHPNYRQSLLEKLFHEEDQLKFHLKFQDNSKSPTQMIAFLRTIRKVVKSPEQQLILYLNYEDTIGHEDEEELLEIIRLLPCAYLILERISIPGKRLNILWNQKRVELKGVCQEFHHRIRKPLPAIGEEEGFSLPSNLYKLRWYCYGMSNASLFQSLQEFHMIGGDFHEVNCLKHLKYLKLQSCQNLEDVSGLGQIPHLIISFCKNLKDISSLTKNQKLEIYHCSKLIQLPDFQNLIELQLGIFIFPNLENLQRKCQRFSVSFQNHDFLTSLNFSNFQQLRILEISFTAKIIELTCPSTIIRLKLETCINLQSVKGLSNLVCREVHLCCRAMTDFTWLHGISKVTMHFCELLISAHDLEEAKEVFLFECCNLVDVKMLGKGDQKVTIKNCYNVKTEI